MWKPVDSSNYKTRKQESKTLRSDAFGNKTTFNKKHVASSTSKTVSVIEEKEKSKTNPKAANVASTALKQSKTVINEVQAQIKTIEKPKTNNSVAQKVFSTASQQKYMLLRAKHLPTTRDIGNTDKTYRKLKNKISKTVKKPNAVLDTPHNVTVSSPPPKRKDGEHNIIEQTNIAENNQNTPLTRRGSRTLTPNEIVILKKGSAQITVQDKFRKEASGIEKPAKPSLKKPIFFEVKLEEKANINHYENESSISNLKIDTINVIHKSIDECTYSDDFESYESDFETGSSTQSQALCEQCNTENKYVSEESLDNCIVSEEINIGNDLSIDENQDELELTQNPITVIQRDKERKLDSGHYEMNSCKAYTPKLNDSSPQFTQYMPDNLEVFSPVTSEQLDSGISTNGAHNLVYNSNTTIEITYGGYQHFNTKPIINQKGSDLLSKIQFDVLGFTLLEVQPISYEVFMQTFAKLNTSQGHTQTQDDLMHMEQQTELNENRTMWTQHPAQYGLEMIEHFNKAGIYNQNCCGELIYEYHKEMLPKCKLDQTLDSLKQINTQSTNRNLQNYQKRQKKPIDYENLNCFLLHSSLLVDQILSSSNHISVQQMQNYPNEKNKVLNRISEQYYYLETNFLNTLRVLKIFSNNKYNLLITVHESLSDRNVYSSDFSNLLMVWSVNICDKPIRLLTTWSQISRVEISNDSSDIIVAALRDGSIALWDLRETYSFCSKLDGYLTHFAATQSTVPSWYRSEGNPELIMDLGSCLDVKSFKSPPNSFLISASFPKTQFVSLHDSGVVTIWTLVENTGNVLPIQSPEKSKYSAKQPLTFQYTSPWARVKLIQSTIANFKDYLEIKSQQIQSRFDKTKAFFQKDIYNDEALKELSEYNSEIGQQGLRFTSLECGSHNLFICTNRNYILMCSKTLKMNKLRRIMINESRFLFPTAMKVLSNEQYLAVGLSNGAVIVLNCQYGKFKPIKESLKVPTTTRPLYPNKKPILDMNTVMSKTCTIQNIVLNSQKLYKNIEFGEEYRPTTATFIALIANKQKPFELRVFDQETIINGSVLRQNLIQSLELSSDGWRLFALTNGHIRAFDFYLDREIECQELQKTGEITDIASGRCSYNKMNLVILKPNTAVEVHILN